MTFDEYIFAIMPNLDVIKKHSKRVTTLFGEDYSDLTFLSYRLLKTIVPNLIKSGNIEKAIFEIVKAKKPNIKLWKVKRLKHSTKLKFYFHVQEQYDAISKLEQMHLYSPPSSDLLSAGINRLDILGDINTIDALAQGDILRWELIQDLPYSKIFDKLLKSKIEREIEKKHAEIMKEKRKSKIK